jgi:hypothetical protein
VVSVLADGPLPAGRHARRWDGQTPLGEAPAGVYFLELATEGRRYVQRGIYLK